MTHTCKLETLETGVGEVKVGDQPSLHSKKREKKRKQKRIKEEERREGRRENMRELKRKKKKEKEKENEERMEKSRETTLGRCSVCSPLNGTVSTLITGYHLKTSIPLYPTSSGSLKT